MKWLLVFVAMFAMDFVWARYTHAIAEHRAMPASFWAVAILGFSGYVTTSYVKDPWMLIPAGVGAFMGTWAAIWWAKRGATDDNR
jgi:lipid-A-disaccharide synthase-like uncharacterized protein